MKKIENTKMVLSNSMKDKFEKRKHLTKHNASNITLNLISVSVLPQNACWSDLEGFVSRKFGSFAFDFRNDKDDIIAGLRFMVTYHCKGQYNSTGQYLAEVTISPYEIFAHPGYEFACNVTASDPINYGTMADPIAGVVLKVQMQVKSYHKLKSSPLYSLEKKDESKVLTAKDASAEEIKITATNNASFVVKPKGTNSSTCYHLKENIAASKISHLYRSRLNSEEQYLNVLVRGDCQVNILSAYGY